MSSLRRTLVVIDPAVRVAETDCFNGIALRSPVPATYHLPALAGMASLEAVKVNVAGIIILGSGSSVHDGLDWQRALSDWLRPRLTAGVPTLGLCFGHQFLAHLLGGKVEFLFPDRQKLTGFRQIRLTKTRLWDAREGAVYVSHREAVTTCPSGMRVVGTSRDCAIEALEHETLPVWSFQSHPEATAAFVNNCGDRVAPGSGQFAFGHSLVQAFIDRL